MPLVRKPGLAAPESLPDVARVVQALQSPDPDERWSAARAALGADGAESALTRALPGEGDARVREAMLTSLARMSTQTSVEAVVSMVRSNDAASRTAALDALRLTPLLSEVIPRLLRDPDVDVRLLSCDLARALPPAQANALLASLLLHEMQPNVSAAAVEVLAEVGERSSLPALAACGNRFPRNEFLSFAIKTVVERIHATSASARG